MYRILYNIYIFCMKNFITLFMPMHSSHLSGFHMSNFGVWIIETSTNGNPKSTESRGMDANKPHFRTLVSLKDDPFSLWFKGGGRICRKHTNVSGMEFWKEFWFPKIEGSVFFPKELRSGLLQSLFSSRSSRLFTVISGENRIEIPLSKTETCAPKKWWSPGKNTHILEDVPVINGLITLMNLCMR